MAKVLALYREQHPVFYFSNTLAAFETLNPNKAQLLIGYLPSYRQFTSWLKSEGYVEFKNSKGITYTLRPIVINRHALPLPDIQLLLL